MKVAIISIGDELMNGFTVDTNSSWIAKKILKYKSLDVVAKVTVKDNEYDIITNLDIFVKKNIDYIFITGGLGPTHDDITKKALSKYFNSKLVLNIPYYKRLQQYFEDRKIKNISHLESQAEILENSSPIPNKYGTALGMRIQYEKSNIFVLPGVPKEVKGMLKEEIFPSYLDPLLSKEKKYVTLLTTGAYESKLFQILETTINENIKNFKVSFLPNYKGVKIRLSKVDKDADLDKFQKNIMNKIEKYVFGVNNEKIEEIIARKLIDKDLTLAVAESCTGGYISKKLTDVPGSSNYFKGSIVAYDNSIKENFLDISAKLLIDKGAVSSDTAIKMAENIRNKFDVDIGLSTTGISGPSGGSDDKPVGLIYIAIATKNKKIVKKFNLIPRRKEHRNIATYTAINMLRLVIK